MTNTITLLDIIEDTVVDGPGFRVSVYAAGCTHHCPGCHNPQSWNLRNGHPVSLDYIVAKINNNPFSNVTFSGGDPLFQVEGFTQLAKRLKIITSKNIWCYTGFRYEEIINSRRLSQILPYIDVLVDGRFDPKGRSALSRKFQPKIDKRSRLSSFRKSNSLGIQPVSPIRLINQIKKSNPMSRFFNKKHEYL